MVYMKEPLSNLWLNINYQQIKVFGSIFYGIRYVCYKVKNHNDIVRFDIIWNFLK